MVACGSTGVLCYTSRENPERRARMAIRVDQPQGVLHPRVVTACGSQVETKATQGGPGSLCSNLVLNAECQSILWSEMGETQGRLDAHSSSRASQTYPHSMGVCCINQWGERNTWINNKSSRGEKPLFLKGSDHLRDSTRSTIISSGFYQLLPQQVLPSWWQDGQECHQSPLTGSQGHLDASPGLLLVHECIPEPTAVATGSNTVMRPGTYKVQVDLIPQATATTGGEEMVGLYAKIRGSLLEKDLLSPIFLWTKTWLPQNPCHRLCVFLCDLKKIACIKPRTGPGRKQESRKSHEVTAFLLDSVSFLLHRDLLLFL